VESWGDWLAPWFGEGESVRFNMTYSDAYGYSHGLMLARNVIKDFRAFARTLGRSAEHACLGVEFHPTTHRAILHAHGMVGGEWSDSDIALAEAEWKRTRGWAVFDRVTDRQGCVEYAAKHLLKQGIDDTFEFWLTPDVYRRSRHERRQARCGQAMRVAGPPETGGRGHRLSTPAPVT